MATTASAVCDALITMLSATSVFGASAVGLTYKVLETASGSAAVVVSLTGFNSISISFGGDKERSWIFGTKLYVKDTGNPNTALARVGKCVDATLACLESDDTLQGTVDTILAIRGSRDPDRLEETGGAIWLPVEVGIEVREL